MAQPSWQSGFFVVSLQFLHFALSWINDRYIFSVLYIMGLLDGMSEAKLKSMNPLVSEMRTIYGRPKLEQIIEAGITKNYGKIMFIVKRHPFKRLFSGKNL